MKALLASIALLLALALSTEAQAQLFSTADCSGGAITGVGVARGSTSYFCLDGAGTDSEAFSASVAWSLQFDPDLGATGATGDAEIYLYKCIVPRSVDLNHCEIVCSDPDLDSTYECDPLTGAISTAGDFRNLAPLDPGWYFIQISTQEGATEESRVELRGASQ